MDLGFTFYPRDWWTSKTFIKLSACDRYIYLEALFYMYLNPQGLEDDRDFFGQFLRTTISAETWQNITKNFVKEGNFFQSETVKRRRTRADASRQNGQSGGRPEGSKKTRENLEKKPEKNPRNPPSEIKGNIKDKLIPSPTVGKGVGISNGVASKPAKTLPPLRAVGFADEAGRIEVWKKYGDWLNAARWHETKLKNEKAAVDAFVFFWPHEVSAQEVEFLESLSLEKLTIVLDSLSQALEYADGEEHNAEDLSDVKSFAI